MAGSSGKYSGPMKIDGRCWTSCARAIDDVENAIGESNSLDDDLKEQALAEISALRRILNAARASARVIGSILSSTLQLFATKFRDTAFGKAATFLIDKIIEYWPAIIAYVLAKTL
jgi:hypothetical protein